MDKISYPTQLPYIEVYCHDTNVANIAFTLAKAGISPPDIKSACELGYGCGITLAVNSRNENVEWSGTDINPEHYLQAKSYSTKASLSISAFKNYELDKKVDYIIVRGVWSWIDDDVKEDILRFIRTYLNERGVVLFSYNVNPGNYELFRLKKVLDTNISKDLPIKKRLSAIRRFLRDLLDQDKPIFNTRLIENILRYNDNYLIHDFMNENLNSSYLDELVYKLSECKLTFVSSVLGYLELSSIHHSQKELDIINRACSRIEKSTISDILSNRNCRLDVYTKGCLPLQSTDRIKYLDNQFEVYLVKNKDRLPSILIEKISKVGDVDYLDYLDKQDKGSLIGDYKTDNRERVYNTISILAVNNNLHLKKVTDKFSYRGNECNFDRLQDGSYLFQGKSGVGIRISKEFKSVLEEYIHSPTNYLEKLSSIGEDAKVFKRLV